VNVQRGTYLEELCAEERPVTEDVPRRGGSEG